MLTLLFLFPVAPYFAGYWSVSPWGKLCFCRNRGHQKQSVDQASGDLELSRDSLMIRDDSGKRKAKQSCRKALASFYSGKMKHVALMSRALSANQRAPVHALSRYESCCTSACIWRGWERGAGFTALTRRAQPSPLLPPKDHLLKFTSHTDSQLHTKHSADALPYRGFKNTAFI